jgi:hypothetical protein
MPGKAPTSSVESPNKFCLRGKSRELFDGSNGPSQTLYYSRNFSAWDDLRVLSCMNSLPKTNARIAVNLREQIQPNARDLYFNRGTEVHRNYVLLKTCKY